MTSGAGCGPLRRDHERGQGMAEYIVIVILVAIIVLAGIRLFGRSIQNQFNNATGEIDTLQADIDDSESGGGRGGAGGGGTGVSG